MGYQTDSQFQSFPFEEDEMKKLYLFLTLLVASTMLLAACGTAATPTPAPVPPTAAPTPTATKAPTATTPPPVCTLLADAPSAPAAGQLGSSGNPITMAFVPSGEAGTIATASSAIADCLNAMTGLTYTIQTGTSYAAAIEAMGAGKAQVGFLNTFSILAAQAKYGIIPALINLRNYSTNSLDPDNGLAGKLEPFYRGQFIANQASGIKTFA